MVFRSGYVLLIATLYVCFASAMSSLTFGQEDPTAVEIRRDWDKLTAAISGGKADEAVAMFLVKGELVDEQGTVYQGQAEIKELLTAFFAKFPGTKMQNEIESIRVLGTIAIQEGRRITTAKDGSVSTMRYTAVLAKTDQGWRIASLRDIGDEALPTPGELLMPLSWLIGDWINEGSDARVKLSYRWSEDKNFILGEISVTRNDKIVMKSSQRIGWDASLGTPRSWTFDSDGGFTESTWTQVQDMWIVRASAVMPEGLTGSAILKITNGEAGRYVMTGTNRIIGDALDDDFEITVVKLPPAAGK
jgi:uncharacterized protein (TIGR02246 family)